MDKQQIISFIEGQLATGKISKADLLNLADNGVGVSAQAPNRAPIDTTTKEESSRNLINTFYGIGAIIAVVGVGILVGQHWTEIGFVGRILVTLGISLATYITALFLNKPAQKMVSQVMFTISAALAPLGAYVLLNEANAIFDLSSQIITSLILVVIYGSALFISKRNILVLITVGFATWAYYAVIMKVFGLSDYSSGDFLKWASMLLGLSYLLVGYGHTALTKTANNEADIKEKNAVENILYALGTFAILLAGISIDGAFNLIFIAIIFAAFYGSVFLKSRSMLILGALFLMAHIIKLTSEYFVDSIGWPVALIGIGFLVIGVGYGTYFLNKKFISSK